MYWMNNHFIGLIKLVMLDYGYLYHGDIECCLIVVQESCWVLFYNRGCWLDQFIFFGGVNIFYFCTSNVNFTFYIEYKHLIEMGLMLFEEKVRGPLELI
jgi:hypothetical protein